MEEKVLSCLQIVMQRQAKQEVMMEMLANKLHLLGANSKTDKGVVVLENPDANPCIGLQTAEAADYMCKQDPLVMKDSVATRHSVAPLEGTLRRSARLQHLLASSQEMASEYENALSTDKDGVRILDRVTLPYYPKPQHPDRPQEGGKVVTVHCV